jgi:hypothetical protein
MDFFNKVDNIKDMTFMNMTLTNEQIFFNIAFLLAFTVACFGLWKISTSQSWTRTNGQVKSIEGRVNHNRNADSGSRIDYIVDVSFSYRIDGREFEGTKIYAGLPNVFSHEKDQTEFIAEFSKDRHIDVYFNPSNHEDSALRVMKLSGFQIFVLSSFVGLVGFIIFAGMNLFLHPSNPIDKFMSKITGS